MISAFKIIFTLVLITVSLSKLYQVVSLFRHGARYHLNSLYDGNATKQVWGQLTATGMRQHETFGKLIRKDYIENQKFLSPTYNKNEIEVYTTDVNRTMMSVQSQLYGLYPSGNGPKMPSVPKQYHLPPYSNKSDIFQQDFALPYGHQPIPFFVDGSIVIINCPNYSNLTKKNIQARQQIYDEQNLTYYPFLKQMANTFNITLSTMTIGRASSLYDTLTVDKFLGRPMPKDFNDSDYLNLRHLHQWLNYFEISLNLSKALNTGKFSRVIRDFDIRILNLTKPTVKWTFLSAHDTDLSAALLDLNISSSQCVEDLFRKGSTTALNCRSNQQYASSLIFELHSDNDIDFYVKIRQNGVYVNLCEQKLTTCSYNEWKARIKRILINVDQVCGPTSINDVNSSRNRYQSSDY